jgi:hypothetical protein
MQTEIKPGDVVLDHSSGTGMTVRYCYRAPDNNPLFRTHRHIRCGLRIMPNVRSRRRFSQPGGGFLLMLIPLSILSAQARN